MAKRLQNIVAESRLSLPVASGYAALVWLAAGLLSHHWWLQAGCYALSTYLMVTLNNSYALLRIYSRMVSCAFIILACMANFLFDSVDGAIVQTTFIGSYLTLFHCYQDKQCVGWIYCSLLLIGIGSLFTPQLLFFVPFIWLLTALQFNALSWRSWAASLLGLLTPYWFVGGWLVMRNDMTPLASHLHRLTDFGTIADISSLPTTHLLVLAVTTILLATGVIHYLRNNYQDKIRTRQYYGFLIIMALQSFVLLALQPQYYNWLIRLLIINTAPIIAHFIALTKTKVTNIACCVIAGVCLLVTAYTLWATTC